MFTETYTSEIIEEIQELTEIDEDKKESILKKIDKLLDNRSRIQSFDCKLYYKAGIRDLEIEKTMGVNNEKSNLMYNDFSKLVDKKDGNVLYNEIKEILEKYI